MNKKLAFIAFVVVALVQLYVPANMILGRENILARGKEYKFRAAPVDPNDPFRGKYMVLELLESQLSVPATNDWVYGADVYVLLTSDSKGYARIKNLSATKPANNIDFVKAKITSAYTTGDTTNISIEYPFERYYMSENKVDNATVVYQESVRDTNQVVYAVVKIKDGDAVLKDVMINGLSIREMEQRKK